MKRRQKSAGKKRLWRKRPPRPKPPKLSEDFQALLESANGRTVTLGDIFEAFPARSHALLFIFFGVPLSSPIGIPVFTTVLGPTLALVGIFLALGKKPWLPRFLREHEVSYASLQKVVGGLLRISLRVEKMLKPRLAFMGVVPPATRVHGIYACIMACIAALPFPIPFGNMIAAVPIVLLGLGLLERDGLFILLAYLGAIPCAVFYVALFLLGREGVELLIHRYLGGA